MSKAGQLPPHEATGEELPQGWSEASLQDVVVGCQSGFASGQKGVEGGLAHLRMNNIGVDCALVMDLVRTVPLSLAKPNHELSKGDVLVCTTNSGKLVGKCAHFDLDGKYAFSNHLTRLRPVAQLVDGRFLAWHLWLQWKAGEFESKCRHWVNQSTLPKEELLETPLAVPPLAEQKRIVAKVEELLSRVTATRDRLAKVLIFLQRFRQSVLAAACFGRLTEEWREKHPDTEPADRLRERIREKRLETAVTPRTRAAVLKAYEECAPLELSPDQELPDTWCLCQINDVGDVCNGSTPSRKHPEYWDGDIPWVSSGEVQNCLIVKTRERITRQGYDNSSVHLLPVGTVLLAMIGEGKTRGQSAVLEIEATINQNMAAIVLCHGLMSPRYLWYWFQHHYETTRQAGGGSGPQALNCQRVRELPLVLPSLEEQREIVRRVEALFARAEEFEKRVKSAALRAGHLMQSILAKAFRGDLVPTEADLARREHRTYEPASVLLARIKAEREREEPRPRRRGRGGRA